MRRAHCPVRMDKRIGTGLRVAMVSETYPPEVNGVARTVAIVAEGLRDRGHEIQLVRPRQGAADQPHDAPGFEELLRPGVPIPRYSQLRMGLPSRRALLEAWHMAPPDIVHIATEGPLGWSALSAARAMDIPVATDFHTNFHAYSSHYGFAWFARAVTGYLRSFHNRADCTMVPTDEMAQDLTRLGFEKLRVVGRGVQFGRVLACEARPGAAGQVVRIRRCAGGALREPFRAGEEFRAGAECVSRDAGSTTRYAPGTGGRRADGGRIEARRARHGDRGPPGEWRAVRALRVGRHLPFPECHRDLRQRHHGSDGQRPRRGGLRLRRSAPAHCARPLGTTGRGKRPHWVHRTRHVSGSRPASRPLARAPCPGSGGNSSVGKR